LYPFLTKSIVLSESITINNTNIKTIDIKSLLLSKYNNNQLKNDDNIKINDENDNISISYIDSNIIDFVINLDYNNLYSIEINNLDQKNQLSDSIIYLYKRSTKLISSEPFLYIDIDSNNNLISNESYNTSYIEKKFNYKIIPIHQTSNFVYFKGMGQYLLKTLNDLININSFDVQIYGSNYKLLNNTYINKNLYSTTTNYQTKPYCSCNLNESSNNKASCYCNYIRHPYNSNNQIDIGLKIGQIRNEVINNIFH